MPECHLSICNVSRKYGRLQAVSHVSAELTEGVYTLLGPNGAGKTTLLSILADLLRPSSGRVCWNDREVHSMGREYRRLLGYLPQKPGFYPDFTGRRMLEYFACLQDIRKPGRRIEELLELVHLREDANGAAAHILLVCCGVWAWQRRFCRIRSCCFWMSPPVDWIRRNSTVSGSSLASCPAAELSFLLPTAYRIWK